MKLLHVLGSLDQRSGGPLRAVLDLSAMSEPLGLHSEILGLGTLSVVDMPIGEDSIHTLRTWGPRSYAYAPGVRQWCRGNLTRFDCVMLHGMWSYTNAVVSRECYAAGIPYVCFPHGMLDLWPVRGQGWFKLVKKTVFWHCIEKHIVNHSSAVLFTLQREMENARRTFSLPSMHALLVIPYGVIPRGGDGSKGPGNPECQRQKEKIALFLGRVHPKKRPDILIQAWSEARIESDWKLVIAGPGEPSYLRHLAELARRGGVEGAVEFAGPVAGARKQELFSSASWFLLPSEQENFGIAVLEAVAGGCAVAVSDQVYLADEFPEGSEILPVRQDAWTGFMRKRMRDSAWRDETARRGQAKLLDRFSAERVSRGWVDSIRSVLSGCADQSTAATK